MNEKTKWNLYIILIIVVIGGSVMWSSYRGNKIINVGKAYCSSKGHIYSGESIKLDNGYGFMCYGIKSDFLVTEWVYYDTNCKYDFSQKSKSCNAEHYVDTADVINK